jgi:non-specific serine/threonine protein kinase
MAERLERYRGASAVVAGLDRLLAADLPSVLTTFVGRDVESTLVSAELSDRSTRLVTLVGPGGVGKTRLALRLAAMVADGFADGVAFVSLAATRSAELVPDVVRHTLGIVSSSERTPAEQVMFVLHERRLLLVLDGFEHLMGATSFVAELIDACPRIVCLVTSRRRLRLAAEHFHHVMPLASPGSHATLDEALASDAVRLFLERANETLDGFTPLPTDIPLIGDICRHLDGLPLAIELAAARMRLLSLADIASMLERHVPIHAEGPTDAPDRLRSLRASVAWSYDLLAPDRQRLLRWLAVFHGSASLAAAESVSADLQATAPALEMLDDIVDLGLMTRAPTIGRTRFAMLETVREVMLEHLELEHESEHARAAHAGYCLVLAEAGEAGIRRSVDQRAWLEELELEQPNVRAAIDWYLATDEPDMAAHIAFWLARFWLIAGHLREARDIYARVTSANGLSDPRRADCIRAWALIEWYAGDMVAATARYSDVASTIDIDSDPASQAFTAWVGTVVLGTLGQLGDARRLAGRAQALRTVLGDTWQMAATVWALAMVELINGNPDAAEPLYRSALNLAASVPDGLLMSIIGVELGITMLARGDARASLVQVQGALADSLPYRPWMHIPQAIESIAAARARLGDPTAAMRLLGAADHLRERLGSARIAGLAWMTEPIRATAQIELGAAAASAAMRAGRELSEDDAIAEALASVDPRGVNATDRRFRVSRRELEVLALVAEGRSDQQIAETLCISTRTASKHVASAIEKLGASNRTGAAAAAIRCGLI